MNTTKRVREWEIGGGAILAALVVIGAAFALVGYYIETQHTERMIRAGFCEVKLESANVLVWRPCPPIGKP